jgi:hypothetical protein
MLVQEEPTLSYRRRLSKAAEKYPYTTLQLEDNIAVIKAIE